MNSFAQSIEDLVMGRAYLPVYAIAASYNDNFHDNPMALLALQIFAENNAKKNLWNTELKNF